MAKFNHAPNMVNLLLFVLCGLVIWFPNILDKSEGKRVGVKPQKAKGVPCPKCKQLLKVTSVTPFVMNCVNVEQGIFGIIRDVNPDDDPVIYDCLTKPGEVIFGNVLIGEDNSPYWLGMGQEINVKGVNYQGDWDPSMTSSVISSPR